mmetsp:Transcript_17162/g.44393  ORF Transcript_17162/g.44393 Transcript_17162/m.44393 type:complete len:323 (-) Transcript_17162:111-1079(-)
MATTIIRRTVASAARVAAPIESIGVVGLGLMGHGIAQAAATAGMHVTGVEREQGALDKGRGRIETSVGKLLARQVSKGEIDQASADTEAARILGNLTYATDIERVAQCDLVIEAIVEDMAIKVPFWSQLGALCKPEAIFASNTSSLPVTAQAVASGRPAQFVGLHFFNPVQLMRLVEVIGTEHTSAATLEAAQAWASRLPDKVVVTCKDTPGFIVNRLLVPSIAQALAMVDRADASIADIDVAMKLGAGHPMGPVLLADYVGLDTTRAILSGWVEAHPDEPAFFVPRCLEAKVAAGHLGRKTGRGFYVWEGDKPKGVATDDA